MLIYNKTGKLVACTSDDALQPLGYESVRDFFDAHEDISEVFIPKVGYVAAYEGLSWVTFLFNDILPQNKVLVNSGIDEEEFIIRSVKLFSQDNDSIGVAFEKCDETTDTVTMPTATQKEIQKPLAEEKSISDDEWLELLNLDSKESDKKDIPKEVSEKAPKDEPKSETPLDDLDQFTLDFEDSKIVEEPKKEEKVEEPIDDDDIYDLNLDFTDEKTEDEEKPKQEEVNVSDFELELKEEEPKNEIEEELQIVADEQDKEPQFEQYIDSDEYKSSKEVDLENLSSELGLELIESANFIYDFTTMIKAKKDSLSGENASIEASSLKNIAENFRLFNIVKTLESIEEGEPNSALLFSQIEKLQKELSLYTQTTPTSQISSLLDWDSATKQSVEFDPNVAAESLGLPTELISEFVNDFVEQARESRDIFDNAYAQNDITTIKETAHKLKGAAANLRIEPIATKLEELQHNEDFNAIPAMLIEFWGMYYGLKEVV